MLIGSLLQIYPFDFKPSAPPAGSYIFYAKTDDVVYIQDSSGTEFPFASASVITSLTGDVTATGPGAAAATVVSVGGSLAADIHSAELAANAATSLNTPNTIAKRDSSGNIELNQLLAANVTLTGTSNIVQLLITGYGGQTANLLEVRRSDTTLLFNIDNSGNSVFLGTIAASNFSGSSSGINTGDQTITLSGDVTGSGTGAITTSISNTTVTGKLLTGYIVGANTPISATDSILSAFEKVQGQINVTAGAAITALTGDVVATGPGSAAATIQPNVVDNTKLAQMPANTLKGNNTGSLANPADLTVTQVTAMLNPFVGDSGSGGLQGLVPAPAPGDTQAGKFLSADGTWEVFPVSGELVSFFTGDASDIGGYLVMTSSPPVGAEVYVTDSSPTTGAIIQSFATPALNPGVSFIPNGVVSVTVHAYKTGGSKNVQLYSEIYKRTSLGVETLIATTNNSVLLGSIEVNLTSMNTIIPDTFLGATDRIVVKVREFISGSGSNPSSITIGFAGVTAARASAPGTTVPAITQLTGDVLAVGPGNVPATVAFVGGSSASNIHSAELAANAATSSNTPNTIVLRGASGEFAAGLITATFSGNLTGNVTGSASNNVLKAGDTMTGELLITAAGTGLNVSNNVIIGGTLNVTSTITASNFSGSSSGTNTGDVTTSNTNSINLAFTSGQTGLNATLNLSAAAADAGNIKATYSIKSDGLFIEIPFGNPVNIGTSNMPGSSSTFSLSDHVHAISSSVVLGLLLTGYVTGSNTPITASNTILTAFENLQAQISATVGAAITALTGDVVATGPGSVAATIQANVVTNAKLAQMPANTLKGNNTGSTANATDLTISQVNVMLGTVTTIGTYDSQTSQANGLDIVGNTLYAQSANTTNPGMVSTGTQSFAGNKTFTGHLSANPSSDIAIFSLQQFSATPTVSSNYFTMFNSTSSIVAYIDSIGNAAFADGGATIPTYGFRNQGGVGMYRQASNKLAFSTSGTGAMYIDASGQVGIGTPTPSTMLDVHGGNIRISNNNSLQLTDNQGSPNIISHKAPTTVTSSYTLVWPAAQGAAGTYLSDDGSGNLSWTNPLVNIDGGTANSVYTSSQLINGGTP